ncbi:MAG: HWE histidine kinase domain-containing protein [Pararhizobium sp.]
MTDKNEEKRIEREIRRGHDSADPFAAAVRATRMPMLITDPRQPDNPIVFANDAFARLTGYAREETLGRNCRFLQGPDTDPAAVDKIRDAVARRVPIEIEILNYRKNGTTFCNRVLISPVFDGDDLIYFFASQYDVTHERERVTRLEVDRGALEAEVERRTHEIAASEERLRFVLEAGRLGAWTFDIESGRLFASGICKESFGRSKTEAFGYDDFKGAILLRDRMRWQEAVQASIDSRVDLDVECRIATPAGSVRWIQIRGRTSFDLQGRPLRLAGVTLDITDRKSAEEHRDMLTREMDHRVKNTLAKVQAIFSQTLRNADSIDEAQKVIAARMQALAATHDVLTREGWTHAGFTDIVAAALRPFRSEGDGRIRAGGPDIRLMPRAATALSLALHELGTNAVKYGALSVTKGFVTLNWWLDDGDTRLRLEWREIDGPPVVAPSHRGFGTRLIEQMLAADFGGTAKLDFRTAGAIFVLEADLSDICEPSFDAEAAQDG